MDTQGARCGRQQAAAVQPDRVWFVAPTVADRELQELGINVAIYSTPCLFAAHTAMANALTELRANDGRLAEVKTDDVGVASSIA